jgi:hypothetical protein
MKLPDDEVAASSRYQAIALTAYGRGGLRNLPPRPQVPI